MHKDRSESSLHHSKKLKHSKSKHKHSSKERNVIKTKTEADDVSLSKISKWERDSPPQKYVKRDDKSRLLEPVFLKDERRKPHQRVHSPVVLDETNRDDKEHKAKSNTNKPNFGRSGLLNNSSAGYSKQTTNFGLSGKLTEDTNTYKGVVIKYNEPADAKIPTEHWRLYAFKGNKHLSVLHIHRQSGFLIGRDRNISDIPMDHPSISKQHAVLQYRLVRDVVLLYIIDLESANGTYLNNNRIEPRRYYELLEKDVIKFGFSTREYVVMSANTADSDDEET